jgi:uncharacterized membrane protein YdbT with pleckstrin-like domain
MEKILDKLEIRPAMSYAVVRILHWVLLALLFLGIAWLLMPAFVLLGVLCMGIGFYKLMYTRCIVYALTDEVLLVRSGILLKRTDSLELFRVKDFVVTENLLMQVLGLMTLELLTTDLTGPIIVLRGIPRSAIAEVIRERVQRARQHNQIVELN